MQPGIKSSRSQLSVVDATSNRQSAARQPLVHVQTQIRQILAEDRPVELNDPTLSEQEKWPRFIMTALSWTLAEIMEGFAACGAAMYPTFLDPPEGAHCHHNPAESRQHKAGD